MLKITAGELRRHTLNSPPDAEKTRPMPARVREALFNLLRGHVEDQPVADFFAGSGVVGLEAISRGASRCVFFERDRDIANLLRSNIEKLGVEDRCEVVQSDALGAGALARTPRPSHLIFFDPPYPLMRNLASRARVLNQFARTVQLLDDDGFAILRTPWPLFVSEDRSQPNADEPASLKVENADGPETHVYRATAIHLYMKQRAADVCGV